MIIDLIAAVEFLKNNDEYLILTHAHPDGDTLGCGFSLCEALTSIGKKAVVRCGDPVPEKYGYMGKVCQEDVKFSNIIATTRSSILGSMPKCRNTWGSPDLVGFSQISTWTLPKLTTAALPMQPLL